jgi:DNA-binding transcriptional LysR family regulator
MNVDGLSLDQMRVAITVAEKGGFSGAARHLSRKQSAVSYAIATLEAQLGVRLFDRADGLRPKPTEIGWILLREMEAVVHRADEIKKQGHAAANGLEDELSITIDSLYPNSALFAVLDGFAERFPTVRLRVDVESMGAVQKSVLDGKAVLGIIGSLPNLMPGLIGDALTRVLRIPVVSPNHPLGAKASGKARLPSRVLLDHVQIVLTDRSDLTKGRDFAVYTGRTWRVSELGLKRDLLIAGFGWGYMPAHMIAHDIAKGALCSLRVEGLRDKNTVALLVVRKTDRVLGPSARWTLSRFMQAAERTTGDVDWPRRATDQVIIEPKGKSIRKNSRRFDSRTNARRKTGREPHAHRPR